MKSATRKRAWPFHTCKSTVLLNADPRTDPVRLREVSKYIMMGILETHVSRSQF